MPSAWCFHSIKNFNGFLQYRATRTWKNKKKRGHTIRVYTENAHSVSVYTCRVYTVIFPYKRRHSFYHRRTNSPSFTVIHLTSLFAGYPEHQHQTAYTAKALKWLIILHCISFSFSYITRRDQISTTVTHSKQHAQTCFAVCSIWCSWTSDRSDR